MSDSAAGKPSLSLEELVKKPSFWVGIASLIAAFVIFGILTAFWYNTHTARPGPFTLRDYTIIPRINTLQFYLDSKGIAPSSVKMRNLTVATATLGGIQPETTGSPNPYLGVVTPEAARDQVRGGA